MDEIQCSRRMPSPPLLPTAGGGRCLRGAKMPPPGQKIKKRASLRFHMKLTWNLKRFSFFPEKFPLFSDVFSAFSRFIPENTGKKAESFKFPSLTLTCQGMEIEADANVKH